jgi:hypothetical protein
MATTVRTMASQGVSTDSWRKLAFAAGALYVITFIAGIPPAAFLLGPVLDNPNYIISTGADSQVLFGAFLDLITALACVGTAVALYPVIKRWSGAASLGFVTTRIFEAGIIVVGVVSLMAVVTLRQTGAAGADAATLVTVGRALVAVRDETFLLGPGFVPGLNAALLGYVIFRSRLVPRVIPAMGLIGAPLFLISASASILGFNEQVSVVSGIVVIPIALWELSLGLWLVFKGFNPAAVAALSTDSSGTDEPAAPAPSPTAVATKAVAA